MAFRVLPQSDPASGHLHSQSHTAPLGLSAESKIPARISLSLIAPCPRFKNVINPDHSASTSVFSAIFLSFYHSLRQMSHIEMQCSLHSAIHQDDP